MEPGPRWCFQRTHGGALAQEKFVTLIAQPDLYGNVLVLFKNVTDGAHLDETPRMRLVDAVDAMADNRGELLFELRGQNAAAVCALSRAARRGYTNVRHFGRAGGDAGTANEPIRVPHLRGVIAELDRRNPTTAMR